MDIYRYAETGPDGNPTAEPGPAIEANPERDIWAQARREAGSTAVCWRCG